MSQRLKCLIIFPLVIMILRWLILNHDLGEEKSGYDVAKYIVEYQLPIGSFRVHSMNPVGRRNIEQLLTHYGYKERNFL